MPVLKGRDLKVWLGENDLRCLGCLQKALSVCDYHGDCGGGVRVLSAAQFPTGCLEVSYLGEHAKGYSGSPLLVLPLMKLMGVYIPFPLRCLWAVGAPAHTGSGMRILWHCPTSQ